MPEERVRQNFARKLHFEYGYPKEQMAFGAPINIGSETRYADIVVYRDQLGARRHDQAKVKFVVETKAPDIKKGEEQLKSYIFASSAEGGVWLNDKDAPKYFRRVEVPFQGLSEWPNVPRSREEWEGVGRHSKQQLRPPHDLVETFRRCHNALYKVGIDSDDLAMDMVRIILAKYQDELNEGDTCEFRCEALELQSTEGRQRVAARIKALFAYVRDENRTVFEEHETITAGPREIATVVSELQDFRFVPDEESDEVYDVVGAAYEVYVGSHLKGDRGQYFTPRLIVQLLVRLVGPTERDIILDPAMGSGGFLIAAMRHVTRAILQSSRTKKSQRAAIKSLHGRLFGIDKSPKLVKVARTNMILASDGHAGLIHGDSLEPSKTLAPAFLLHAAPGMPTVILTNPPFGATSEHRITAEREPEILSQFELGHVWRRNARGVLMPTEDLTGEGVPPEYLFVERCLRWLAPGGKLGIVLPRGVLDNERALPLRTFLLRHARVLAVVNCHDDTFKPHTDAKAAMIVCEKKTTPADADDDYQIFMAISQSIGHTGLAEPIYRTDSNGDVILINGRPIIDQDLDDIYLAWKALREGRESPSGYYFKTSRAQLAGNLALNPVRYLPRYSNSLQRVLRLGEQENWSVERLGNIAKVFGGPRLKRPYADKDVTSVSGPNILRFFTGNAVTQTRGENIKYLDLAKAKPPQVKMINQMILKRGMILITRSGTTGRVIYATAYHEGAIGTEDVIRVVIDDEALRGYVYQFLLSPLGQDQLKANIYGGIIDHIEPAHVREILVPVPIDKNKIAAIGGPVIEGVVLQEQAYDRLEHARLLLEQATGRSASTSDESRPLSSGSDTLSSVAESEVLQLERIQAGGKRYHLRPPVSYVLRQEGSHVLAEAAEFHLYAEGADKQRASEELGRHLSALIEGYAFEDDASLAKSGQKLKQLLLARLRRV